MFPLFQVLKKANMLVLICFALICLFARTSVANDTYTLRFDGTSYKISTNARDGEVVCVATYQPTYETVGWDIQLPARPDPV